MSTRYVAITKDGDNYSVDTNATPVGGIDGLYVSTFETSAADHVMFMFDSTKELTGRQKMDDSDWEDIDFDIAYGTPSSIKIYSISLGGFGYFYEVTFEGRTYNINELFGDIPALQDGMENIDNI